MSVKELVAGAGARRFQYTPLKPNDICKHVESLLSAFHIRYLNFIHWQSHFCRSEINKHQADFRTESTRLPVRRASPAA